MYKPFLFAFLLCVPSISRAQCAGFPATVADANCSGGTPLTSGANMNSGSTFSYCGTSAAFVSFTGLNLNGGTMRICGNASLSGNWNGGVIVVSCGSTVKFPSGLLLNNGAKLINYGTVIVTGDVNFQNLDNCVYNENTSSSITVSGDMIFPQNNGQNVYLKNAGYIKVSGTFQALDGGFTCFTNTGQMECANLKYIQNCGGPANRFTFGSATGTCILRVTNNAQLNASFTSSSAWIVSKATAATQNLNCSSTWGSATVISSSASLVAPLSPQTCAMSNCFTSPLPVELLSFNAAAEGKAVVLEWSTATEVNNDYFTIEKSEDAVHWKVLGEVKGAGNSNVEQQYTYTDHSPYAGTSYYRLGQTDFNGTITDKGEISVDVPVASAVAIQVYPNPTMGDVNIAVTGLTPGTEVRLVVMDYSGRPVWVRSVMPDQAVVSASFTGLAGGLYTVCVYTGTELLGSTRIIKQ